MRRDEVKDIEDTLQKQTWYMTPARYEQLFLNSDPYSPEPLTMAGRPVEEVVDDIDELDRYFDQLDEKRSLTGADLFGGDFSGEWV